MPLTKTDETTVYAIASIASNSVSVGTALDVSTYYGCLLRIKMGRATGSAFTTAPICRIEGTAEQSAATANQWTVLAQFQPAVGATLASQAVSGTEAAGQTTVTLAAATNFGSGDYVFFHNTTLANSEWSRVVSISTNDLILEEGLVFAQTGATARDQAEQYLCSLDLTALNKLRVVIDGRATGQAVIFEVQGGFVSGL